MTPGRSCPRAYPKTPNLPNFKDLSPRVGAAYDLFGNGRTALKVALGRYVSLVGPNLAQIFHPGFLQVSSATRTWTDTNADFIPECNMGVAGANGECGPISDTKFGQPINNTSLGADAFTGFGNRFNNWQTSASVQHEIRPGLSVTVGYFRVCGNFMITDNQAVGPAYDPYCVTAPVMSHCPAAAAIRSRGFYDVKPEAFGPGEQSGHALFRTTAKTEVYNGVDVTMNARFGKGGVLAGGMSTGRTVNDNCFQNSDPSLTAQFPPGVTAASTPPRTQDFCHTVLPFSGQTQFKFSGAYPLPWDFQASATYQNLPGIPIAATYVATNAAIRPSLGRTLGQCGTSATCNGTVVVDLMPPNTDFEDRITQLDLRLTRAFIFGRTRVTGTFDIFNALNANPFCRANAVRHPGCSRQRFWRIIKFGAQLSFEGGFDSARLRQSLIF